MNEAVKQVAYSGVKVKFTEARIQRFWSRVDVRQANECWLWLRSRVRKGYGRFWCVDKTYRAHRAAWIICFGDIPIGIDVLHTCDNPPCCNPAHLWLGNTKDNVQDMFAKGRDNQPKGTNHGCAKLTDERVRQIRKRYNRGEFAIELGQEYGVNPRTIRRIASRDSWAHVR